MLSIAIIVSISIVGCIVGCSACNKLSKKSKSQTIHIQVDREGLADFLDEAENMYIKCYEENEPNIFSAYATTNVIDKITDEINQGREKLFGISRYRHTKWELISDNGRTLTIKKELEHEHLEVKQGIRISVGDDMKEIWRVLCNRGAYIIEDITQC